MLDKLQLTEYKQAIAESYDLRSHRYEDKACRLSRSLKFNNLSIL